MKVTLAANTFLYQLLYQCLRLYNHLLIANIRPKQVKQFGLFLIGACTTLACIVVIQILIGIDGNTCIYK